MTAGNAQELIHSHFLNRRIQTRQLLDSRILQYRPGLAPRPPPPLPIDERPLPTSVSEARETLFSWDQSIPNSSPDFSSLSVIEKYTERRSLGDSEQWAELPNILIKCLSAQRPPEIQLAALGILTNIFLRPSRELGDAFLERGIVPILWDVIHRHDAALSGLCFRCLTNIAVDSAEARNEVLRTLSATSHDLLDFACSTDYKTQKWMVRLLRACCAFPIADAKPLIALLEWAIAQAPTTIVDVILQALAEIAVSDPGLVAANSLRIRFLESILGIYDDPRILNDVLYLFVKLTEGGFIIDELDFSNVVSLLGSEDDGVVLKVLRLISNVIIARPVLADFFCQKQVTGESVIQTAVELTERPRLRVEALFLLTDFTRLGSMAVVSTCIDNEVVSLFVEGLALEQRDLSEAALCSLARVFVCEKELTMRVGVVDQFHRASGNVALDLLITGPILHIAQLAQVFRNCFRGNPEDGALPSTF
jgi:hypothetical protein